MTPLARTRRVLSRAGSFAPFLLRPAMQDVSLFEIGLLLAAAAIAAPLAKWLRVGTVLGYLVAGIVLGPYGIGKVFSVYEAKEILHIAEFGVVLLLFLIGLELRPKRLWSMRQVIFGLGGAQVAITAIPLAAAAMALFQLPAAPAVFVGLALALSSTAFALQVLEEKGELTQRHGRSAFGVLLFQDLAAIPLIALVPLFAVSKMGSGPPMGLALALKALGTIVGVVVVGRFVLDPLFRLIARARVKEALTAAALLVVVGVAVVMQAAGLPASLGAFIAGALLAESSYRHQIEADIQPFEGLLLGLFFTAIGMSLNLQLLVQKPVAILALVVGLITIKAAILYGLGVWQKLGPWGARRLALSIAQGGEFAFVLFASGIAAGVLSKSLGELLSVVVTLSMAVTPALLLIDDAWGRPVALPLMTAEPLPEHDGHIIIAGFGRFGQITARILRAKRIPFTALDISAEQVDFVKKFGSQVFYGDAARPDILAAAKADKATAFVLAIDDIEASVRTAEMVKLHYPALPIYARARNRIHAHRLMDVGVKFVHRETFASALELSGDVLRGVGQSERDVRQALTMFRRLDEERLFDDYKVYSDTEKLQERARSNAVTLEQLFDEDAAAQLRNKASSIERLTSPPSAHKSALDKTASDKTSSDKTAATQMPPPPTTIAVKKD
jgi:glutathione-regulated potassium-efflux system protein KefB